MGSKEPSYSGSVEVTKAGLQDVGKTHFYDIEWDADGGTDLDSNAHPVNGMLIMNEDTMILAGGWAIDTSEGDDDDSDAAGGGAVGYMVEMDDEKVLKMAKGVYSMIDSTGAETQGITLVMPEGAAGAEEDGEEEDNENDDGEQAAETEAD